MASLSTKKAGISGLEKKAEYRRKADVCHSLEDIPGLNYVAGRCSYFPSGFCIRSYQPGKICEGQVLRNAQYLKKKKTQHRRPGRARVV